MYTYFGLFLIATFASLVLTPLVRRLCERFNLLDVPVDGRRMHSKAVPRLGGVAIYISCLLALATLPFIDNILTQTLRGYTPQILVALIPATLVFLFGVYDDLRGTNATVKLVALGAIATLFFIMGGRVEFLSIPFLGSFQLPGIVSFIVTVVWLVAIANAFNLIDGMDGLASGAALFASLVILTISFAQGQPVMIVFSLVLCGALAGFLRYNFNPASIFLGDSGALFVGFTLAAMSVVGSQKASTAVAIVIPILAFGVPVVDTVVTIARRFVSRKPVFQGDNEHIHHMLIARGWSQQRAVLILYAACAAFGLTAILFSGTSSRLIGFGLFVLAVITILALGHLRYHEVDELRAGFKRTVGDRRNRIANNLRVRRASVAFSKAADLNELFDAMKVMLESEEFAYAHLELGQPKHSESNRRAFEAIGSRNSERPPQFINGRVVWSWKQNGLSEDAVLESTNFWRFSLPLTTGNTEWGWMNLYRTLDGPPLLVDMNYLAGFFRTHLAEAVGRILQSSEKPINAGAATAGKSAMTMRAGKGGNVAASYGR
ncbi:MAG TPA: MraY family glycosyltransferase [Pyrinomonadaceae bacterium]|nr:MraY family glycosyltransferase [Pyrinomonadaceae bacterium]